MNKKGFTIVELLASFSLALVILVLLFNVVLTLKDNYEKTNNLTELLLKKDNLSYAINNKFQNKEITNVQMCNDKTYCLEFTYQDLSSDKLIYDEENKVITFDNYTFEITDDIEVGSILLTTNNEPNKSLWYSSNFVLTIEINQNDKDYSIRVLYNYNPSITTISV